MKMFALALAVMLPCLAAAAGGQKPGQPERTDADGSVGRFHLPALQNASRTDYCRRIIADYVTPGKAYLVFHEFTLTGPGHEHSRTASLYAAAAARVGKYQQVADALFQTQSSWAVSGKVWEAVAPALTPAEQKKVQALMKRPNRKRRSAARSGRGPGRARGPHAHPGNDAQGQADPMEQLGRLRPFQEHGGSAAQQVNVQ